MLFSSQIFLFLFLPICLSVYFLCDSIQSRNRVLIIFSSVFFIWGDFKFFLIVLVGTLLDYLFIKYGFNNPRFSRSLSRKLIFIFAIGVNVCLLIFYKYGNFIIDQLLLILSILNIQSLNGTALHSHWESHL